MRFTSPYILESNFITKQSWHILDIINKIMLANNKLSKKFWIETMVIATYLKNFLLTTFKEKVTKELQILKRQNVSHLVIFGCFTYIEIPKKKKKKFQ